ncbi:2OG-Fe(II) oxygenase family protein [Amycolatopsis sp. EV170708-02-1]|uniref:2OG-Fe(II) oxygenase family protein n=1 Tax=Amycolatopsis sp. EV170708-02-1 TaxID=2919322 RepID=UPI001F0C4A03|nr:2OG-Fe(II) oxygenase family protein [Amycolatopsis sp. EV170708-02-1]UMO99999.1 hypothetical protein MJQ72_26205 [Amycolatopsis sp. EV170708-02-1]
MTSPPIRLQRAEARGDTIRFERPDGAARALADGFFALAIPDHFDPGPGINFCRKFHLPRHGREDDAYRGFRSLPKIYFDREDFQVEHVLTDTESRRRYFPSQLTKMVDSMTDIGLTVLRSTLADLNIPATLWDRATSGAAHGHGTHWFVAHHYRGRRDQPGCAPHKDTGFVTILFAETPGLETFRDGTWHAVDPLPGHFIVNFGQSFEILTRRLARSTTASLHRVRRFASRELAQDRISFAAFIDPPLTGKLYRIHEDETVSSEISIEDFLRLNNEKTWNDHADFGVSAPSRKN